MTQPPSISCPHAERCSGCPLIGLAPGSQLAWKTERVRAALAPYPELDALHLEPIRAAEPIHGYRRRAKLVAAPPAHLGLFARDTDHEVTDIPGCRALTPALVEAADALRRALAAGGERLGVFDPNQPLRHAVAVRAVDLRETRSGDQVSVLATLVLSAESERNGDALLAVGQALFEAIPRCTSLAVSFHDGSSPQLLGRRLRVLGGRHAVPDELGVAGLQQLAAHGAFVQVHRGQATALGALVAGALGDALGTALAGARVLELFGGSGALGLPLARAGARVLAIESFPPAVQRANDAAFDAGLADHARSAGAPASAARPAYEARAGDAGEVIGALAASGERFDAVLVNPPRRGVSPAAREAILRVAPRAVVYVSCDPGTLARDLAHLEVLGFATERLVPFDMIPLTEEVECVAVLTPASPPPPRVLFESAEIVAVDKPAPEPTIPHPEHPGSLLARVRALPDCEHAVPIHRLDAGTSGVVLFAKRAAHVTAWSKALGEESAEKAYVALVRGIVRAKGSITRDVREGKRRLAARSRYQRLEVVAGHSLVRVRPDQGRTHQIRQHLAAIDHAVLGDARYGHAPSNRHVGERYGLDRTFLHCARIELDAPGGERLVIESALAPDLAAVLERMRAPARRGTDEAA